MKHIHTQESGRSMVEMLGVLAIIGVLSVGGIAGYSQAMSKFKITKTIDQVQTIITNVRTLYAGSRKFTSLTPKQAYDMGILTEETLDGSDSNATGLNPFGGRIIFGTADSGRTFTVEYNGLTGEACVRLATADWGADQSSGLTKIEVGTTNNNAIAVGSTHQWSGTTDATSLPVQVTSAVSSCGAGNAGAVRWTFK